MYAWTKAGARIVGTFERVIARANALRGEFSRDKDGTLVCEHEGYTEIFWDAQETITKDGKTVFLCENGEEWTEDDIVLTDEDEPPEQEAA